MPYKCKETQKAYKKAWNKNNKYKTNAKQRYRSNCNNLLKRIENRSEEAKMSGMPFFEYCLSVISKKAERRLQKQRECVLRQKAKNKKANAEYIEGIKKKSWCKMCGEEDWRVLVFHHHIGIKKGNICTLSSKGCTITKLKRELERCITLCCNCHHLHHYHGEKLRN